MDILSLFYPHKCVCCNEIIKSGSVCKNCIGKIEYLHENSVTENGIIYSYRYDYSDITSIVMEIKQSKNMPLANFMADRIIDAVCSYIPDVSEYTLTYVPRKLSKHLVNGIDQSRLLAELCANKLGIPFVSLIKRKAFTSEQKKLNYAGRKLNLHGKLSCRIPKDGSIPSKILIIDDISTTGTTLTEAKSALIKYLGIDESNIKLACFAATPKKTSAKT